jgi:hypothetical protein
VLRHVYEVRPRKDKRGFDLIFRCAPKSFFDCRTVNDPAMMSLMKIEDYIKKYALTQRDVPRVGKWIPDSLTVPWDDDFQVFGNDDGTHVVMLNTTKKKFKIMHGDMVFLETDWLDARIDYKTDAKPFWK